MKRTVFTVLTTLIFSILLLGALPVAVISTPTTDREQDYITLTRTYNRQVWEGINNLKALQREWNAQDYGNTLDDGAGANLGITKAMVGAVVFDSADALEAVLDGGIAGNMSKLL